MSKTTLDEILDGRVCPTCFRVVEIIDESIIFDETIKSETLKQTLKCENKSCPTLYRAKRFGNDWYIDKSISKQAINSLFKELVAEAKPFDYVPDGHEADACLNHERYTSACCGCQRQKTRNHAVYEFEQNLLKELEEV